MISVIIPIYNAAEHLEKCVGSLLKQSCREFEIILVDDGSTDGSADICDALCEKHVNIRVTHSENRGVAAARNTGIDMAVGELVTFIDADDCVPANYLEELYACIGEADISVCDVALYRGDEEICRFSCTDKLLDSADAVCRLLERKDINTGPCGKLFRRQTIKAIRFPALRVYEDILFVLGAFDKAASVAFTAKTEYSYIQNGESAMGTLNAVKCLDAVKASDAVCGYIKSKGGALFEKPFYTTVSHMFQYFIKEPATADEIILDKAFIEILAKYRKEIRACKAFPFKERLIFLAASHNIRLKNGIGRLI